MSRENVAVIRRSYEALNQGGLEAALAAVDDVADPEFEWRATGRLPDVPPVRGREAAKDLFMQLSTVFDWHIEVEEAIDAGDTAVMVVRQIAKGKTSGAEVTNRQVHVWGFRHGKVAYFETYLTKERALEAVALSEQGARADS
jgi:ketosteroid isomerase-like protein